MGLIIKKLMVEGNKNAIRLDVLFDTGARSSVIKKDVAEKLSSLIPLKEVKIFGTAKRGTKISANEAVILNIQINGTSLDGRFYAIPRLNRDIIIGADFMQNWGIVLEPRKEKITVGVDPNNIELLRV